MGTIHKPLNDCGNGVPDDTFCRNISPVFLIPCLLYFLRVAITWPSLTLDPHISNGHSEYSEHTFNRILCAFLFYVFAYLPITKQIKDQGEKNLPAATPVMFFVHFKSLTKKNNSLRTFTMRSKSFSP